MIKHGPTSWVPASSREFRSYLRQAKAAAKKGDPDPSKSSKAPACFDALHHMALDQLHHQAGFMLDDIQADREAWAAYRDVEERLDTSAELPEDLERRILLARKARERILGRFQRFQTECHSIAANWARMDREMQEVYRQYYKYADYIGELVFPALDVASIRYGEDGGFSLAALLPGWPSGDEPRTAVKRALIR